MRDRSNYKRLSLLMISMILLFSTSTVSAAGIPSEIQMAETEQSVTEENQTAGTDGFEFKEDDNGEGIMITGYNGVEEELVIPSVIDGKAVTGIKNSAFEDCDDLRSITIPDSVKEIGISAFKDCISLESIVIPNSVTEIGGSVFFGCKSLKNVTLPEGLTRIGYSAFAYCDKLGDIMIPGSVEEIGKGAFRGCSSLGSIGVEESNAYYTSVDGILCSKDRTELVCYPNGKGDGVIFPADIKVICEEAFSDFLALTGIAIPEGVEVIEWNAFRGCENLISISIPGSVREIKRSINKGFFESCGRLVQIDVADSNAEYMSKDNVLYNKDMTELLYCLRGKTGNFTIPDGVESIGMGAFTACGSLTGITIPESVTEIWDSFSSTWDWTCINVAGNNPAYASWEGMLFNKSMTELVRCPSGKKDSIVIPGSVTTLKSKSFYNCFRLTSIRIPDSIKRISFDAFILCLGLKEVYYEGSQEQWHRIETDNSMHAYVGDKLPGCDEAKIYCNITAKENLAIIVQGAEEKLKGNKADYPAERWEALEQAIAAANEAIENGDDPSLAAAKTALETAITGFKTYAEIQAEEARAKEKARNDLAAAVHTAISAGAASGYTPESWAEYQKALANAQAVLNNADASSAQLAEAKTALAQAAAKLVRVHQEPEGKKVNSIKFAKKVYQIAQGKKIDLKKEITVLPTDASNKKIIWKISNSKYAKVENGAVKVFKAGAGKKVTVTATAADGSGKQASVQIRIMKNAVKKITLKAPKTKVKAGKSITVKAAVKANGKDANKTLKWSSSNPKYATVNAKGKVKTKKAGKGKSVTITAAATDGTNKKAFVRIKIK